jgi:hypothetical protein
MPPWPRGEPVPPTEPAESDSYEVVKARHERHCARVLSPEGYIEVLPLLFGGNQGTHFRRPFHWSTRAHAVRKRYQALCFYERGRDGQLRRHSFIGRWLRDKAIRTLDAVVCDPRGGLPRTLNTFRGFRAASLPPLDDGAAWALVEPIWAHILEVLIPFNQPALDIVLDWFAHLLQRPAVRTRLALVMRGGYGCGNDFLATWHAEHIMGPLYSEVVFRPAETRRVADSIMVISRLQGALKSNLDALKDLAVRYDCRRRGRVEENYSNVYVTTESNRFVRMAEAHREFLAFQCSDAHQGDPAYFASLMHHLLRPEVMRAWYQTLMARDLSAYRDTRSFQLAADAVSPWRPPQDEYAQEDCPSPTDSD